MKRTAWFALFLSSACAHGNWCISRRPSFDEAATDSLYWSAVANLDPSNKNGTLEAGLASLDAYLASPASAKHSREAAVLRTLARNSQQLARVETALQQARTSGDNKRNESDVKVRDEEMVKEIQRLKEELSKANDELERIKKRLASPKT